MADLQLYVWKAGTIAEELLLNAYVIAGKRYSLLVKVCAVGRVRKVAVAYACLTKQVGGTENLQRSKGKDVSRRVFILDNKGIKLSI